MLNDFLKMNYGISDELMDIYTEIRNLKMSTFK